MDAIELELLKQDVDALASALAEERYRHVAGIEPEPALAAVFQARPRTAHKATIAALTAAGDAALARRVAELRAERAAAEDEETWRAAEATARCQGFEGATVPLPEAERTASRDHRRDRRDAWARGVAAAVSDVAPRREAAAETRARSLAEVGFFPDWDLVLEADDLLDRTQDGYRDVLAWLASHQLALHLPPRGDLRREDLLHLLLLPAYEGLFPRGMLAVILERVAGRLQLDLSAVRVDEGERPAQWPGAHAFGTRISFRRAGGAADWLALFRAAGVALTAAVGAPFHVQEASLPFVLGELLAGLLLEPRFLERELEVERRQVTDLVRLLALRELFRVRCAAAALRVATEVERGTTGARWREAHREALSGAALATWPDGFAARDADRARHAAALAGAAEAARLRRSLQEQFDEDWWRNPRTGEYLSALLAAGRTAPAGVERPKLPEAGAELVRRLE